MQGRSPDDQRSFRLAGCGISLSCFQEALVTAELIKGSLCLHEIACIQRVVHLLLAEQDLIFDVSDWIFEIVKGFCYLASSINQQEDM